MKWFTVAISLLLATQAFADPSDPLATQRFREPVGNVDGTPVRNLYRCEMLLYTSTGQAKRMRFPAEAPMGGGVHLWSWQNILGETPKGCGLSVIFCASLDGPSPALVQLFDFEGCTGEFVSPMVHGVYGNTRPLPPSEVKE